MQKSVFKASREKGKKIIRIQSDHRKEFDNEGFNSFCLLEGIHHEFSAPITPQQNGVVERKNRTLQEMAHVMIHANSSDDPGKSLKKSSEEIITKKSELIPSAYVKKNHPTSTIIGDPSAGMQTRRKDKIDYLKMVANLCYTSTIEPSTVDCALKDEYWLNSLQ